ncbi:MAG: serine/threonine protein kinase [Nostoc sp. DedVER02]|uniref:serine/threonine protein kinase n=1 Tax=unclassified Nostoc TaxID=2593658 RepID=UPI002AD40C9C|nr:MULTISPECIES: serine/threonine-protein kinase [unclassified Nostoc]MDZ7985251.1 serine/threonine-protein kinase [Nostoc sp. DedVER02]MDZ8115189.1 serine/threonine-protein kinase [Nostoc sp. DedVER01b]
MIGEILAERYEVQQLLGKKAGRRTLVARDLNTQELVVIKLLSFGGDFEWDSLKLFEREAETLKSLSHPLIPRYLDYFEVNLPTIKGFALVQTYIPAKTLEQYLQSGRTFTEAEVKQIAKALLEILIYLHGLYPPIIHRDIKPSNILLGERSGNSVGQVYLVDFGSVQTVFATEGGTRTVVGSYGYMPQEQFGGRTVPASDLYSLGATLIYLVTGTHPADLPQRDFRIQFEQVANVSPGLTRWLKLMTEPSLERRFSSASEAIAALDKPATTNLPTLIVDKPDGSKIQLIKNRDSLEIIIPPPGLNLSILFTGLFAIAWNSFIFLWTITALSAPFPANILFALFSLPFWGVGFFTINKLLYPLFGCIRLRLDREQIAFTTELLGFKSNRTHPTPRQHIRKLIYTPKRFEIDLSSNTRVEVPPELIIWAGVKKYQLAGSNGVINSEPEIEWLAQELSDWLNIPITRE